MQRGWAGTTVGQLGQHVHKFQRTGLLPPNTVSIIRQRREAGRHRGTSQARPAPETRITHPALPISVGRCELVQSEQGAQVGQQLSRASSRVDRITCSGTLNHGSK